MARRKQIRRHVSKAQWSPHELKRIRAALEAKHGNGPRAQTRVTEELGRLKNASTDERVEWRRADAKVRA